MSNVTFYANSEERESQNPICNKCGRLKDEELSEVDYTTHYVCHHCENAAQGYLVIKEIKGLNFD